MKVLALFLVVVAVAAQPQTKSSKPYYPSNPTIKDAIKESAKEAVAKIPAPAQLVEEIYYEPVKPKPYNFGYFIKNEETFTDYQREEKSDGKVVSGSYRVNLPDGRVQIVNYRSSPETGNVMDVKYEGVARYPDYVPAVKEVKKSSDYPVKSVYKSSEAKAAPAAKVSVEAAPAAAPKVAEPIPAPAPLKAAPPKYSAPVRAPAAKLVEAPVAAVKISTPVQPPAAKVSAPQVAVAPVVIPEIKSAPAAPAPVIIKEKRKAIRYQGPEFEPLPVPAAYRRPIRFGGKI